MFAIGILLVMTVAWVTGCNEPASPRAGAALRAVAAQPCTAEPLAPFDCAQEGGQAVGTLHFSGVVTGTEGTDEFGRLHFEVKEPSGAVHRLAFQAAGQPVPVEVGSSYEFELDRVGGMPTASGLIVRDQQGLVFAGASDQDIGSHVLEAGVPGFGLELLASSCPSRGEGDCFDAVFNRPLQVSFGGGTVTLHQGESAQLGGYEVRCLIAQQVKYRASCADFALYAVSYTIGRLK
jgi:hypothetical protein